MTIDVAVSRTIPKPTEQVAAYLMDPRHDPEWIGGLVHVEPPDRGLEAGTRVSRVAKFMGRRIDYVLEVEALEPGRRLVMRSIAAPFPMRVAYEVAPNGDGSDVTLRVGGGPGGAMRVLHPLMAWQVRRNLAGDLRRLEARLTTAP